MLIADCLMNYFTSAHSIIAKQVIQVAYYQFYSLVVGKTEAIILSHRSLGCV